MVIDLSTVNGVRVADVGWYSPERFAEIRGQIAFDIAPEICVEVISPSNRPSGMAEKKQLCFEAGAEEVWFCEEYGRMTFSGRESPDQALPQSRLCPSFPASV